MFWVLFFIVVLALVVAATHAEFWIFKNPRNKTVNYRIEYTFSNQRYVVNTKTKPFKNATSLLFTTHTTPGSFKQSENSLDCCNTELQETIDFFVKEMESPFAMEAI